MFFSLKRLATAKHIIMAGQQKRHLTNTKHTRKKDKSEQHKESIYTLTLLSHLSLNCAIFTSETQKCTKQT